MKKNPLLNSEQNCIPSTEHTETLSFCGNNGQNHSDQNGTAVTNFLRDIREKKKFSQRFFAQKLNISRTHLQRLESRPIEEIPFGELRRVVQHLGYKLEELVGQTPCSQNLNSVLSRCALTEPVFLIDSMKGIRFGSYLESPSAYFVGTLTMEPQKTGSV